MPEPQRTPISEAMLQTVIRGGQFVDPTQEWMGPQRPIEPVTPPEVAGRQFDYPVGFNINIKPRTAEPVTFEQLRALADNLDILRLVIETRKDLVCALEWEIVPKDKSKEPDSRCEKIQEVLQLPDREHTWQEWLRMLLEDLFVLDAPCVYPRLTKGGQLYSLDPIDGATITRKIDQTGRTPVPPQVAYQQVLKGVPAGDFTRDELIYRPRNLRTNRIYGYSPVEQIIMTVNIALRRQINQLQFYTEGSTPDLIMTVPMDWTVDQVDRFQLWWNEQLSGNTAQRRKTRFVPGGVAAINAKEGLLKDEYDEWLSRIITYAFSVPNQQFIKQMNRSTAETAQDQAVSEGLLPMLNWVKSLVEYVIIRYFGYRDLTLDWTDNRDPDLLQAAQIDLLKAQAEQIRINSGVLDENEVRGDLGLKALTPEELEARNPPPPPPPQAPAGEAGKPQEPQQAAPEPKAPDQSGKLEKKKPKVRAINRNRRQIVRLRNGLRKFLTEYLRQKGSAVAQQAARLYQQIGKSEEDDRMSELVAQLDIDFDDLVPELQDYLREIVREGVSAGAVQIRLNSEDATRLANDRAEAWAADRAAEMVGKQWVDGRLVDNPDAEWAISESTREMIRSAVADAIDEGWSNDKLADAIMESEGFDAARAEMIARTETAFADIQGNKAAYEAAIDSGLSVRWQWVTAGDDLVSDECEMNADEIREIGEEFPSGATEPPQHPNCRCDVLPVVASESEPG